MSLKSRNFLLTLNNPTVNTAEYLETIHSKLKAVYTCGQLERGAEGTAHIQFFMNFKEPIRCAAIKKADNRLHIEVVKVNNGAHDYCMKEDTRVEGPYEYGTKPVQRNSKTDWEEVKQKAISGDLESIPADIYIKHYRTLKEIKKDHMVVQPRTIPR